MPLFAALIAASLFAAPADAAHKDPKVQAVIKNGLEWIANSQSRLGHWSAAEGRYPTAMTALAGMALLGEGSTTTQGKYAPNIRRAVDYLVSRSRTNGLIGDPGRDDRYTYGHGYSMLFLSQVLGEEEDMDRRETLVEVLTKAVHFTGEAQTEAGGWGYVSAKDGHGFDEGSTTITQVQGLRGCRNAGIAVPKEVIDKAIQLHPQLHAARRRRAVQLEGGRRPTGDHRGGHRLSVQRRRLRQRVRAEAAGLLQPQSLEHRQRGVRPLALRPLLLRPGDVSRGRARNGRNTATRSTTDLVAEASGNGSWNQGYIGPIYTTAINLTILQLDEARLPIYQR